MKAQLSKLFNLAVVAGIVAAGCATPPAPTPETIVQTQIVNVVETQVVVATQQVEVVVTATPSPISGTVKALLIGKPDEDGIDPVTGAAIPGIQHLKDEFAKSYPNIDLQIVNIPWGSGSTGYGPKTESMMQGQEACVYMMPGAADFGRRGYLVNLDTMIANDPNFKNAWGDSIDQYRGWGPGNPDNLWALPYSGGNRVIHYDATIFKDWGVEPLSLHPTLQEIEEKAAKMTGKDPVTGEQTYGYWYQGKYINWQFQSIAHAFGANWGKVNEDGTWTINWDTPEYLQALEWLVKMNKYAPPGALAADAMPEGFLTDQNVVAIIPEGENGYYIGPFLAQPELQQRYRTVYNLQGPDGKGGLYASDPISMAASCDNKPAAWEVMKWLAGSPELQKYNFETGNLPVIEGAADAIPTLNSFVDADAILNQNLHAEICYPWATAQPRWSLQSAIEEALAGTLTPKAALERAQKETEDWLAQQQTGTP